MLCGDADFDAGVALVCFVAVRWSSDVTDVLVILCCSCWLLVDLVVHFEVPAITFSVFTSIGTVSVSFGLFSR